MLLTLMGLLVLAVRSRWTKRIAKHKLEGVPIIAIGTRVGRPLAEIANDINLLRHASTK